MSDKTSKTEANKASVFPTSPKTNSDLVAIPAEAIVDNANSDAEPVEASDSDTESIAVNTTVYAEVNSIEVQSAETNNTDEESVADNSTEDGDSKGKNTQSNNPLHGVKLQTIIEDLEEQYGWDGLAYRININCFKSDPSIKSSLKFLRRTPWARDKVERLYLKTFHKKYRPESY
ncbi:MAG: hypothetical protein ACI89W_001458 [Gammaproteobacteria bacterium]|jgi:hypothetical protein|tara:strand:- start:150 stop:674 length:525 start_codon:yes stop_codon:yes gene_type:complete